MGWRCGRLGMFSSMDVSSVQARVRSPFAVDAVLMSLFCDEVGMGCPCWGWGFQGVGMCV